ncbi:MAG: non-ribosomal peptide synthetase [bacterium]|nr:non-ribosomal peptide synthetase [bacterium]
MNLQTVYNSIIGTTTRDRVVLFGSPAFDASLYETCQALFNGAVLCIPTRETMYDYRKYEDYLNRLGATSLILPPVYMNNLQAERVKPIRVMVSGGARPSYATIDKWKGQTQYINAFGPTEDTVMCTMNKFDPALPRYGTVPVGSPVPNERLYILDKMGHICPVGVAGELFIAGDGLARGYLNRPELTLEKFIDNPYEPGHKMYVTGDSGRWLPGGMIEFLGRIDHMVKIRGFRIEPGEIESHLMKMKEVTETAVIAKENEMGEGYLCAYIFTDAGTGTDGETLTASSVRQYLSEDLPDYMIPSYFMFMKMEEMPLTPSDKLDRKALPEIQTTTESSYVPPHGKIEKDLVTIWSEVLGVEEQKIGIDDTYFELGGNSIKIIQIKQKIQEHFQRDIPVTSLFRYPSVRSLADCISRELQGGEEGNENGLISQDELGDMQSSIRDTIQLFGDD